jgi:hypothetical protein
MYPVHIPALRMVRVWHLARVASALPGPLPPTLGLGYAAGLDLTPSSCWRAKTGSATFCQPIAVSPSESPERARDPCHSAPTRWHAVAGTPR